MNNYCGYFIKELPNGFLCLDNMIQTLGMLLDFRNAKNTRLVFCYAFLQSRNIPCVWITLSKHEKPSGISLILIGSTPIFLYFDLYLYFAYAAHYVYCLTSAHILNVSFVFPFLARTFSIPWCPGGRAIFGHEVSYDVLRRFRKIADRRLGRGRGEI